jgi:hypothetical protein
MSSKEGRQSPPPEQQSGAQLKDAPASGQGTDEAPNKKQTLEDQLKVRSNSISRVADGTDHYTGPRVEPQGPYR